MLLGKIESSIHSNKRSSNHVRHGTRQKHNAVGNILRIHQVVVVNHSLDVGAQSDLEQVRVQLLPQFRLNAARAYCVDADLVFAKLMRHVSGYCQNGCLCSAVNHGVRLSTADSGFLNERSFTTL